MATCVVITAEGGEDDEETRQYGSKGYWDERYTASLAVRTSSDETTEWLVSYEQVAPLLGGAMSRGRKSRVLDVGCGPSSFLADMRQSGHYGVLVGIDISGISLAREINAGHDILIEEVDALDCAARFGGDSFDVVVDKSTIDAMLCDLKSGLDNVRRMCVHVETLLAEGGIYFVVSHNSPDTDQDGEILIADWLEKVMDGLTTESSTWKLDIHVTEGPSVYLFTRLRRSRRKGVYVQDSTSPMEIELHEH